MSGTEWRGVCNDGWVLPVIGNIRPWADPAINSMGRLPMAPPTAAHASIADARQADPLDTADAPWRTSLNGKWAFRLFDHPDNVPATAVTKALSGGSW